MPTFHSIHFFILIHNLKKKIFNIKKTRKISFAQTHQNYTIQSKEENISKNAKKAVQIDMSVEDLHQEAIF